VLRGAEAIASLEGFGEAFDADAGRMDFHLAEDDESACPVTWLGISTKTEE
jgi:hypothetical protein